MKKYIVLIIAVCLTLTGCVKPIELKERAIVQAIGIDTIGGRYNLTIIYYSPVGTTGEQAAQNTQVNSKLVTSSGETLADAFNNIELKNGKTNFYGHNDIVVIGKSVAERALGKVISYMSGDLSLRANVELLAADGMAQEILSARPDENIMPPTALINTVRNARQEGTIPDVHFIDAANAYIGEKRDVLLPLISVKPEQENRSSYFAGGAVVYRSDIYAGVLDENEALGISFCMQNLKNRVISAGNVNALNITDISSKIKRDGNMMNISVSCSALITDTSLNRADLYADEAEKSAENYIGQLIYSGVSKTNTAYKSDVFGIGVCDKISVKVDVKIDKSGAILIKP